MVEIQILGNVLIGLLLATSAAVAGLALRAWWYAREVRTLMLFVAFTLIFAQAVGLAWWSFQVVELGTPLLALAGADLAVVIAFYAASLR